MSGTTSSSLMNAPRGMGGTVPASLSTARDGMAGAVPWPSSSLLRGGRADTSRSAAVRPSGDRAMHSAASSAVAKLPRRTLLPPRLTCAW
eukprot:scaffold78373_cov53-Phaeocystis_antarctica.AAC.4